MQPSLGSLANDQVTMALKNRGQQDKIGSWNHSSNDRNQTGAQEDWREA
jgi:hypothetical protein